MSLSGQNVANGEVQRVFRRLILFQLTASGGLLTSRTQSFQIMGLDKSINCMVQVGAIRPGSTGTYPYLANPGTIQITPITKGEGTETPLFGNPIFSPPAFTGALVIPNGWEFSSLAAQAQVDVVVDPTKWAVSQGTAGDQIVADVAINYTGSWWDPAAIAKILNRVSLQPLFDGALRITGAL